MGPVGGCLRPHGRGINRGNRQWQPLLTFLISPTSNTKPVTFRRRSNFAARSCPLNPALASAWCFLGAACQSQGKLAEAVDRYHTSLRIKPDYAEAHYNLGVRPYSGGDRSVAAIMRFHQALASNPDYREAIDMLEEVLAEAEKLAGAAKQGPGHPSLLLYGQAHYNLGVVRARRGQIDEAIAHYRQALHINPDSMETHNNLANLLYQKGQWNEQRPASRKLCGAVPIVRKRTQTWAHP